MLRDQNMFGNCGGLAIYFVTTQRDILDIHICHKFVVIRIRISNTHQTSYHHPNVDLRLRLLKTFASWVCSSPHDLAGAMIQHCGQEYLLLWQQPLLLIGCFEPMYIGTRKQLRVIPLRLLDKSTTASAIYSAIQSAFARHWFVQQHCSGQQIQSARQIDSSFCSTNVISGLCWCTLCGFRDNAITIVGCVSIHVLLIVELCEHV